MMSDAFNDIIFRLKSLVCNLVIVLNDTIKTAGALTVHGDPQPLARRIDKAVACTVEPAGEICL